MVSVKNFHRSARARPPPADTPDESSAVTTSQVTPSIQDFAVSLDKRVGALVKAFLKAGIFTELGDREETSSGTPQGGIITPPTQ